MISQIKRLTCLVNAKKTAAESWLENVKALSVWVDF